MKKNIRNARLKKIAQSKKDQSGMFTHFNTEIENSTRQRRLREIDKASERDSLYDVSFTQEESESDSLANLSTGPLSTRYVPGTARQALHIGGGLRQDPLTNKIFDHSEPYSHDGENYPGGSVSLQSSIMYLTSNLEEAGQIKYSRRIYDLLNKLATIDEE